MPFTRCIGWWWRDTKNNLFFCKFLFSISHLALVVAFCLLKIPLSLGLDKIGCKDLTFKTQTSVSVKNVHNLMINFVLQFWKKKCCLVEMISLWPFILFALGLLMLRERDGLKNFSPYLTPSSFRKVTLSFGCKFGFRMKSCNI